MKNSEAVSTVTNQLRYLNKDEAISRRFVLSKLRETSRFLISQKLKDRTLYREDSIESWIECLAMEPIDSVKCDIIEFKTCKNLMRSVSKLPEIIYSRYGAGLSKVYSIDGENEYDYITLRQYNLNKKRSGGKKKYFYIKNDYLYLTDSTTERVNIPIITIETEKLAALNACTPQTCDSIWEMELIGSDRFQKTIIDMVIQELMNSMKKISPDENPNLNENIKNSTQP